MCVSVTVTVHQCVCRRAPGRGALARAVAARPASRDERDERDRTPAPRRREAASPGRPGNARRRRARWPCCVRLSPRSGCWPQPWCTPPTHTALSRIRSHGNPSTARLPHGTAACQRTPSLSVRQLRCILKRTANSAGSEARLITAADTAWLFAAQTRPTGASRPRRTRPTHGNSPAPMARHVFGSITVRSDSRHTSHLIAW